MISKEKFKSLILAMKSEITSLLYTNEIYNSELCLDVAMMYLEITIPDLYKYPEVKNLIESYILKNNYDLDKIYNFYINETRG